MAQRLSLNQFTITNIKGRVNTAPSLLTKDFQIDPTSLDTFYPGTFVTLTATGTVIKALATSTKLMCPVVFNSVTEVHTANLNFMVTVALGTTECTAEAGGTIAAGDQLEYNPTGDVLITSAGTNTVVGIALESATVGQTFSFRVSTANN